MLPKKLICVHNDEFPNITEKITATFFQIPWGPRQALVTKIYIINYHLTVGLNTSRKRIACEICEFYPGEHGSNCIHYSEGSSTGVNALYPDKGEKEVVLELMRSSKVKQTNVCKRIKDEGIDFVVFLVCPNGLGLSQQSRKILTDNIAHGTNSVAQERIYRDHRNKGTCEKRRHGPNSNPRPRQHKAEA